MEVLGLASEAEALADLVANAYAAMLPDAIAKILIKSPLSNDDQVKLIRRSIEREGYPALASLPDDYA